MEELRERTIKKQVDSYRQPKGQLSHDGEWHRWVDKSRLANIISEVLSGQTRIR